MDQAHPPRRKPRLPDVNRRGFLQAAAGAIATSGTSRAIAARAPPRPAPESVLVVGAGLSGLACAYRLRDAGLRVTLIEARAEPGGRVRTLRGYFDDGLYAELGAARVAETHEYVIHWLNELDLSLIPFAPSGAGVQAIGNLHARTDDLAARERMAPGLKPDERNLSVSQLMIKYLSGVPDDLANPDIDLADPRWRPFDSVTWPAWLASRGASKAAIQLITLGGDSSGFSALFLLQQIMLHRDSRSYLKIEGGMDRLPRAIAARLKDAIHYNCELTRLERTATGVRATCRTPAGMDIFAANRAVLAIPFSTLKQVAIEPAFSPQKTKIIQSLIYHEATRFLLQTKTRFWTKAGLNGGARTDGPADIWDMSYGQKAARGLISLTTGNTAIDQRLSSLPEAGRAQFGAGLAKQAFLELESELQKTYVQRWSENPFARGAFTVFRPGQMTAWAPVMGLPEGRVHFAGEHIAPFNGWMEGALWSGERAAQEILQQ